MGIERREPEQHDPWGGLPAEPAGSSSPAEELAVAGAVDAAAFGIGGMSGIESVVVALPARPTEE